MKRLSTVWYAALLGVLCAALSTASAQPQPRTPPSPGQPSPSAEDRARAETARKEGNQLAQQGDYKGAAEKLKEAYRLSRDPSILYDIGAAYDKLNDVRLALFYYKKYLEDADPKSDKAGKREEVSQRIAALEQVRETKPDEETAATSFAHKVIEEAPPRMPIDITVKVPEGSGWSARLLYRAAHENQFVSTVMRARPEGLVGRIPAAKTTGTAVQYYIEIYDRNGVLIDSSGRSNSPNLVSLDANAKPVYYADIEDPDWPGPTPIGPLGPEDRPRTALEIAKWTSTAVAVASVATWVTAYVSAGNYSSHLEDDARASAETDDCIFTQGPCRAFSLYQRDIEADGKRWETIANISMGIGLVTAGAAGYFWYRDLKGGKRAERAAQADTLQGRRVTAVPMIGEGVIGGAATVDF